MLKVFISAGEPSGDLHAAKLMKELKLLYGDIQFFGLGGGKMTEQGLRPIVPMNDISVVGFWEVARKYSFFRKLLQTCTDILINEKIDLFIPVDYPGFNMILAGRAKAAGIKTAYYIAPQLWAWGESRARKLAGAVNKLLVVFPFEKEFFAKYGIDTEFVGHPLLDEKEFSENVKPYHERQKQILLMPGSRRQEVKRHCELLEKTFSYAPSLIKEFNIIMAVSPNLEKRIVDDIKARNPKWNYSSNTRELIADSLCGVIKTGTSTLEAALLGLPFAMIYKASVISYIIGKSRLKLPYVALPNILAGKPIIREFIQKDANPKNIINELEKISDRNEFVRIQDEFNIVRKNLGEPGASSRAADLIMKFIKR